MFHGFIIMEVYIGCLLSYFVFLEVTISSEKDLFSCGNYPFPTLSPRDLNKVDHYILFFWPATLIHSEIGSVLFKIFFNVYLFLRETERESSRREGPEREGDTESEAGSRLRAVSTEPYVGLELTECTIMTWAKVRHLSGWATQVPQAQSYLKAALPDKGYKFYYLGVAEKMAYISLILGCPIFIHILTSLILGYSL